MIKQPTETAESITCQECLMPAASQQTLIDHADGSSTLLCVKCPFCKQIVDAHMTKISISCPKCKVTVNY